MHKKRILSFFERTDFMKKTWVSALCVLSCMAIFPFSAFAEEVEIDPQTKEAMTASADAMLRTLSYGTSYSVNDVESQNIDTSYNLEDAYTVTMLESYPATTYAKTGDFSQVLTEETEIFLPYFGGDMVFDADGELLYLSMDTVPTLQTDEVDAMITFDLSGQTVTDITYTYSELYGATFVYIQTTTGEYIIPYLHIAGLETDIPTAVYDLSDFMSAMDATFDESFYQNSDEIYYGNSVVMKDESASALYALTPVVAEEAVSISADAKTFSWFIPYGFAILAIITFSCITLGKKYMKTSTTSV